LTPDCACREETFHTESNASARHAGFLALPSGSQVAPSPLPTPSQYPEISLLKRLPLRSLRQSRPEAMDRPS